MLCDIFYDFDKKTTLVKLTDALGDVPEGFISDGGSVPRALWSWCDPLDGRWLPHFVKHDWRYVSHTLPRKEADLELYEGLREAGMSWTKAKIIYEAVRCFGTTHW